MSEPRHATPGNDPPPAGPRETMDWGACLAANGDWLKKVILARTAEPQAVEEVFQRVAMAALSQKSPLADPARAGPWLHRVAVIQSARYRRRMGRERRAMRGVAAQSDGENGAGGDPLAWLLSKERHEQTRQAVLQLPPRDAEILLLKYGEGWRYRQIAERLGISEKAVDGRLARARTRLRQELIAKGINEEDL